MYRLQNRIFPRHALAVVLLLTLLGFAISAIPANAFAAQRSTSASSSGVVFTVEWDDDVPAGEATSFHVSATGGSEQAKARMEAPSYWQPAHGYGNSSEGVCDPSRGTWLAYYQLGEDGHDFTFEFTASGAYSINFFFMDTENSVTYLRATTVVSVNDASRPSVDQIVGSAVAQAKSETDGSDYQMALWLHDWTLDQLEYDHSLNWCSAESGLTRGKGTCESYQRIYQRLLNSAGISNARIVGNGHTWNAVKIDGAWCQVDPTWDDNNDTWYGFNMRHFYFGLTDELMGAAHPDLVSQYQADSYAYRSIDFRNSYYVRNGEAAKWASVYKDRVQSKLDAGIEEFAIAADGLDSGSSYTEQIYNGNVAYALGQMRWQANGKSVKLQVTSDETSFTFKADYSDESSSGGAGMGSGDSRVQAVPVPALKKVAGLKLKAKKKAIKLSWKKGGADISGYQIRYSKSKKMKRAKIIKLTRAAAKSKTIKKLVKKKRYYVQIRSYKTLNGKTYYSAWSSTKSAKAK